MFPGNDQVFHDLAALIRDQRAVAFVGAGVSAGLYPTWNQFIDALADHAVTQGKASPRDAARWKQDTSPTPQQRVNTIVRRLGETLYRDFVAATFGPRRHADGNAYSPVHAALVRLPFRGFVTTNYDPALDFARADLRPGCRTTGTPTWQDDEEVYLWRTGDVFERYDCPMLWLHGFYQKPDSIVLNSGDYSQAYKPGIYRETFKELWIRERLVFVGFGFNDPQFTFMIGEFLRDLASANAAPRHIAILGWHMDGSGVPDAEDVRDRCDSLLADYHLRPFFYPVVDGDHAALGRLLDTLAVESTAARSAAPTIAASTTASAETRRAPAVWIHESTDDDKFTGRAAEIEQLDRWTRDEAVRAIAVCGIGGTGKSALVGRWLRHTHGWRARPFDGLFAWSFYQNRSARAFVQQLLEWARVNLGVTVGASAATRDAGRLLHHHALMLVLDGLEVLQEGPEGRHGTFLDSDLRELLQMLCADASCRGIAVLTSRFVFADLERYLGTTFHQLDLGGLPPDHGALLLAELGVRGMPADREAVSARLDGHPLALRVFAEAIPGGDLAEPLAFLERAFSLHHPQEGAALSRKIKRLLEFYDRKLTPVERQLLMVVSLFRSPAAEETLIRVAHGLGVPAAPVPDAAAATSALNRLHARGILSREPIDGGHGYALHPVLRDHFRAALLGAGGAAAQRAADLLAGQPSAQRATTVKDIEPVLLAIDLLLDAEELVAADDLYRGRLEEGELFKSIPAIAEGLACTIGFVRDDARRRRCEAMLSSEKLHTYMTYVGFLAGYSGRHKLGLEFCDEAIGLARRQRWADRAGLRSSLLNKVDLLVFDGQLAEARAVADEALALGRDDRSERSLWGPYLYRAWAEAFTGPVVDAARDFARSLASEGVQYQTLFRGLQFSNVGFWTTELLVRTGHTRLGAERAMFSLPTAEHIGAKDIAGYCCWMLGRCQLADGQIDDAEKNLRHAEEIFRTGQMLFWLARLYVTMGDLLLARQDVGGAQNQAANALAIAQPRSMKIAHADALILRGRCRLADVARTNPLQALDDARDARRVARDAGYIWAERDALALEAEAHLAIARRTESSDLARASAANSAAKARAEATALSVTLTLTTEQLRQLDNDARRFRHDSDRDDT